MFETMEKNEGVGLAANQVGHDLQLAVIKADGKAHILINPKIRSKSWKKIVDEEGCLSFPGLRFPVKRHAKVRVKALNRSGKIFEIRAEGLLSRVLQHEVDHLNGIPFTKRRVKVKKSKTQKI
jgi:peptide deformylase